MATVHESNIRKLTPPSNGILTVFNTPEEYIAGSLRLFWNGIAVNPDDDRYGWAETGSNEITTVNPPRAGTVLQAFYRLLGGIEVSPAYVVVGSPHAPGECGGP